MPSRPVEQVVPLAIPKLVNLLVRRLVFRMVVAHTNLLQKPVHVRSGPVYPQPRRTVSLGRTGQSSPLAWELGADDSLNLPFPVSYSPLFFTSTATCFIIGCRLLALKSPIGQSTLSSGMYPMAPPAGMSYVTAR